MLMPALSVTGIGIVIAVVGILRGNRATAMLVRGLVGAWLGFLAGAIPGVLIDVVLGTGGYLALLGHLGAAAGATVAVVRGASARTASRRPE